MVLHDQFQLNMLNKKTAFIKIEVAQQAKGKTVFDGLLERQV